MLLYHFLNVLFGWTGLAVNPHSFLHPWHRILRWWPSTLHFDCVEVASPRLCGGLLFLGFFLLGWHVSPGMIPRSAGYPRLPLRTSDIWDLPPCAFFQHDAWMFIRPMRMRALVLAASERKGLSLHKTIYHGLVQSSCSKLYAWVWISGWHWWAFCCSSGISPHSCRSFSNCFRPGHLEGLVKVNLVGCSDLL